MPTISDLRQQAATIKNATQVGENTATRVGTTFETIADLLEGANVGQGIPSVDLAQLNSLRTPADQTTTNPTVYNVTTLHNLSSTTIKVGTLFVFSDGGRAVVTQILLSNYQVDGGGNISSPNTSQITMYYRMFNIVQETWSAWTLYAGGGGGGTIDPYPVSGSDNAVASNGVFEGLQKAAPEVNINDLDDLDDYVNMQTGEASTYTIKAYHNLSSTWLRVGVLMVFANQANNTLTQICISNCMVDGGGNLIPNYTTNAMNVFYRFKQFSGNPPEGMTIGVWTTWAKFGDSGYQPDNEDIDLNASDQLQFANKSYDASAFSGLGRVYLRKNIVTSGGVDKNVLTQAMVNTAKTIYHIQYDYDLNGQTITLPAGCVLEFDGGSVKNGTITGNNSVIRASNNGCFDNVILNGTWTNNEFCLEWWKMSTATNYDNSTNVQFALDSARRVRRISVSGKYGISKPIHTETMTIYGKAITNFKDYGFVANDDFAEDTHVYGEVTYAVKGMFYHANNEHPRFERIIIDANFKAKYCVEHIAGSSNVDFYYTEVYHAQVAGVLQYACERPVWKGLYAVDCNIGAFISTRQYDATKFPTFSGTTSMGQANLVLLDGCRFTGCNFGLIINGGSNTALRDCETAYNGTFGLVFSGAKIYSTNYYSEGDGTGRFYLYADGTKEYNQNGNSYVNQYMINNNIDGLETLGTQYTILDSVAHLRSIAYIYSSNVTLQKSFYSFIPRSHKIDDPAADAIVSPTERETAGVDAIIIVSRSEIADTDSTLYNHTAQGSEPASPWVCVYNLMHSAQIEGSTTMRGMMKSYGVEGNETAFVAQFPVTSAPKKYGCTLEGAIMPQLNTDINTRVYGVSANAVPINVFKIKEQYNGMPLYKRNTAFTQCAVFYVLKTDLESRFGNRDYIKARVVIHLPAQASTGFPINYRYLNNYSLVSAGFNCDSGAQRTLDAGYYDFIFPIRLKYEGGEWNRLAIYTTIRNEENIEAYISDIFFYDIADAEMRVPFIEHPTIQRGITTYRPYLPDKGQKYYDTTISKWIEWDGTQWVDTTGTAV